MKEKNYYAPVQKWMRQNLRESCAIELKLVKTKSFRFDDVKDHQVANLLSVNRGFLSWKIADVGFDQKPFDLFSLNKSNAYVGVIFYEERKKKNLYLIPIKVFILLKGSSVARSLTELEVSCFASHSASLKDY